MFYKRLGDETQPMAKELAYVQDQYRHFREDTVQFALEAQTDKQSPETERLNEAAEIAQQGVEHVLDFINQCEDPLRLFFASMACSLCRPNLDDYLTEGTILQISGENVTELAKNCSMMPKKLQKAGKLFMQARNVLRENNTCQERWYVHTQTWLDRAARLSLLRSKDIRPKYVESTFLKALQNKGYVYEPEDWGDVLLLHISVLATDDERRTFVAQDEMRFFVPKESRIQDMREKAQNLDDPDFSDHTDDEGPSNTDADDDSDNITAEASNGANSLSELSETSEMSEDQELKCVNGRKRRWHCQCHHCWTGVSCNVKMVEGPGINQEFEPLVAERAAGAGGYHQELAVQGCQLHTDLRYQLARITLVPISEAAEGRRKTEDLCKSPQASYSNALRLKIPSRVSRRQYVYSIDAPIGAFARYEVCYCYGVECFDDKDWQTKASLAGWSSVGQVEVVNTEEERDAVVLKMFEPTALKARWIREQPAKLCKTDWYLKEQETFFFVRRGQNVFFNCSEGFQNLKGIEQLTCHNGAWKVAKHSEDNPMEQKLSPPDMAVWEQGQFPECSWKHAGSCTTDDPLSVVSPRSPPITNDFSGDGRVHYRCNPKKGTGQPMRLVVWEPELNLTKGAQVIFDRSKVAEVLSFQEKKYEIKLLESGEKKTAEPDKIEWLPSDTSYVRWCGEGGKYEPSQVKIRCLLVLPSETEKEDADDDQSAKGDFASGAFVPEQDATTTTTKKLAAASLLEQSGSSLLEASASGGGAVRAKAAQVEQAVDRSPSLQLQPWPVMFSQDAEHVLHVDSCWMSAMNCSDGTVAKDTVRSLQKESVMLEMPPAVSEEAVQRSWGLAGCAALALILGLMLLGWSSQSPSPSQTGKRRMSK